MPFGLRNAGATFARLIYKVLANQIGRNIEAYVDDIVVKSLKASDHPADLKETFENLRNTGIMLNPAKCVFGVKAGRMLGFLVSQRGIEANPDKIKAIIDMTPPQNPKEVQRLNGRLAALGRFLVREAERSVPFFQSLRGAAPFHWGPEQQKAFEDMKKHLAEIATLTAPTPGAPLLLYVVASPSAVSAVLVEEKGNR